MHDRPIPRPNSFTLEEWVSLGREEQIRWWKAYVKRTKQPFDVVKVLKRREIFTPTELANIILVNLTDVNAHEVLMASPADVHQILRDHTASLPADDDENGWNEFLFIRSVNYPAWVTEEEIQTAEQDERRRFRTGVRLFRAHFQPK